jgi:hypothetical protein
MLLTQSSAEEISWQFTTSCDDTSSAADSGNELVVRNAKPNSKKSPSKKKRKKRKKKKSGTSAAKSVTHKDSRPTDEVLEKESAKPLAAGSSRDSFSDDDEVFLDLEEDVDDEVARFGKMLQSVHIERPSSSHELFPSMKITFKSNKNSFSKSKSAPDIHDE